VPSLRELRRATADRVAPFELATSGVLEGATYVGTAFSGSRRRIVTTDLVSIDSLGVGPENPGDYLKNEWVYLLTDPAQQRRVPEAGFVGYARADETVSGTTPALTPVDTPVAYLDVERPFGALVAAGTDFEVHGIPPERGGRSVGLHQHIAKALRVMLREDTVLVPGTTGQTVLDVTASFPWITNPGCFVGARYVATISGVESYGIPGARLRFDGEKVLLTPNTYVGTGQSLPVSVLRPLATWIKPSLSSVWVESSVGLVEEDDMVLGDADAISLVAAFHAAEEQAHLSPVGSPEATYWLARAAAFAARSPFLRDQRTQRPRYASSVWPDFVSVDGPYGGRWGPGFR
jgi:hypothetical protein